MIPSWNLIAVEILTIHELCRTRSEVIYIMVDWRVAFLMILPSFQSGKCIKYTKSCPIKNWYHAKIRFCCNWNSWINKLWFGISVLRSKLDRICDNLLNTGVSLPKMTLFYCFLYQVCCCNVKLEPNESI